MDKFPNFEEDSIGVFIKNISEILGEEVAAEVKNYYEKYGCPD
jgi:hypothetical protein